MQPSSQVEADFNFVATYNIPYTYVSLARTALTYPTLEGFLQTLSPNDQELGTTIYKHVRNAPSSPKFIERVNKEASYPSTQRNKLPDLSIARIIKSYYNSINQAVNYINPLGLTQRQVIPRNAVITDPVIYDISYDLDLTSLKDLSPYQILDRAVLTPEIPLVVLVSSSVETPSAKGSGKEENKENRIIYRAYTSASQPTIPELKDEGVYVFFASSESCGGVGTSAFYSPETHKFTITIPVRSKQKIRCDTSSILASFNKVFEKVIPPSLSVDKIDVGSEDGGFYILGLDRAVNLSVLAEILQRRRYFNYFVALRENVYRPYNNSKLSLDYRNPEALIFGEFRNSQFKFSIEQFKAASRQILYLEKTAVEVPADSYYLHITYRAVPKTELRDGLMFFITRLVSAVYADGRSDSIVNLRQITIRETAKGESNLESLKSVAPELFSSKYYSIDCTKAIQPLPFFKEGQGEEEEEGEQDLVIDEKRGTYRKAIQYPDPDIEPELAEYAHYYQCPNPNFPVPGLKRNKGANKNVFTYYPCCYANASSAQGERSAYFRYINNPYHKISIKSNTAIERGTLGTGQTGKLHNELSMLLGIEGQRYCVNEDVNSFVNTLCYIFYPEYRSIFETSEYNNVTVGKLNRVVEEVLKQVARVVNPGVMKQELYDVNNADLCSILGKEQVFTSDQHFHLFEVFFQTNIFVFTKQDSLARMEIARHMDYSVRSPVSLNSIVLILNDQNYYEIVMPTVLAPEQRIGGNFIFSSENKTQTLFDMYNATSNNNILGVGEVSGEKESENVLPVSYIGTYLTPILSLLQSSSIYQYIDNHGKLRALVVMMGTIPVPLIVTPSQPLNLPVSETINDTDYTNALQVITKLKGKNLMRSNFKEGIFFSLPSLSNDREGELYQLYIPLHFTEGKNKEYLTLPISKQTPFIHSELSINESTTAYTSQEISKLAELLWQVIRFGLIFFTLESKAFKDEIPKIFNRDYLKLEPTNYSFHHRSFLPASFSIGEVTFFDYLKWVSLNYPSMANESGFKISSEKLKQKIEQRINRYAPHVRPHPIYQFFGLYEYPSDFEKHPNELVFTDTPSYKYWLQRETQDKTMDIKLKIEPEDKFGLTRYLFLHFPSAENKEPPSLATLDPRIYLIVNAYRTDIPNDFTEALYISAYWQKYRRNVGSWRVAGTIAQKLNHIEKEFGVHGLCTYIVTPLGQLDLPAPQPNCLPIIKYSDYKFAAILPI